MTDVQSRIPSARIAAMRVALLDATAVPDDQLPTATELVYLTEEVLALRAALLVYLRAHGNVRSLPRDLVEVELFKAFLTACNTLGIAANDATRDPIPGVIADTPDVQSDLAKIVHAAWVEGMGHQSRPVPEHRRTWAVLPDPDRRLDAYIAGAILAYFTGRFIFAAGRTPPTETP